MQETAVVAAMQAMAVTAVTIRTAAVFLDGAKALRKVMAAIPVHLVPVAVQDL
jgi:hypothetical protein